MLKFIGYTLLIIVGLFALLTIHSYFTYGHGNPKVKAEHELRDTKVLEYCKGMQSYGMFKGRLQQCIDQNKRAWDSNSVMRAEIMRGYSE